MSQGKLRSEKEMTSYVKDHPFRSLPLPPPERCEGLDYQLLDAVLLAKRYLPHIDEHTRTHTDGAGSFCYICLRVPV
jgi:hypothetical protein